MPSTWQKNTKCGKLDTKRSRWIHHQITNNYLKLKEMKKILLIIAISSVALGFSQTELRKSSISTGGGSTSVGTTQVIYSIGEVAVQEHTQGTTHLSEGFIGPDMAQALGITDYGTLSGISVYPNPVKDNFNLNLPQSSTYEVYLYNLQGKQIFFRQVNDTQQNFDSSRLTSAGYLLIVIDRKNKLKKTFKIIKN